MTEKIVINCDVSDCVEEYEHIGGDFLIMDITDRNWIYVPESETHYCSSCKSEVIKELDADGVEYID